MSEKKSRWDKLLERVPGRGIAYSMILVSGLAVLYKIGRDDISKDDYSINLYTEFLGVIVSVIVAFFILDEMNRRRDDRRREQEFRKQLILDLHSPNNSTAIEAIHKMHVRDWLSGEESPLRKRVFFEVDWRNARLSGSDMEDAKFFDARLEGANLSAAFMYFAYMRRINLAKADLRDAHLECADLSFACLVGTNLSSANLMDTELKGANLKDADCYWANFEGPIWSTP